MRKINLFLLLAMLFCGFSAVSCSDSDNDKEIVEEYGFFTKEINKLIDDNYPEVMKNGYAELIIPADMFDQDIMKYADYHKQVMSDLNSLGYVTYINGGAVRDAILGTSIHDLDFSTNATPEQMVEQLTGYDVAVKQTGGGAIAQAYHSNGDWTDMVPIKGVSESLRGMEGVPADATYGTYSTRLLDDTYSRDLTINSIYYDFENGNIIDYHGGLHDLREQIIRTVYDADIMYAVNSSALIRTVRFAARYGYDIDETTAKAIADNMHYCEENITPSLNNYYIMKGFGDGCASRTYDYYMKYDIVEFFMPVLKDYAGTDVYDNQLKSTVSYLESHSKLYAELAMAALFLPVMKEELGETEKTLENITAKWDELIETSGQNKRFDIDDYSNGRTNMLNIWYVYFSLSDDSLSEEELAALKDNPAYSGGVLLSEAVMSVK